MANPTLSLVLVCYRSSAHTPAAVRSFRQEADRSQIATEVVLVDHSEDEAERCALAQLKPDVLLCQKNRGFAAGVNAGVLKARGDVLMVGNPDIAFGEGSIQALLGCLSKGFDIVGPQFVFGQWLLPPADVQSPAAEAARILSSRFRLAWKLWWRREMRRCLTLWGAQHVQEIPFLSGALLTFPRTVWDKVGPFDESYFLYFEETDWLLRARRQGCRIGFVPQSRVTHRWAHVAKGPEMTAHMLRSRRRYYAKNFGLRGRWLASRSPKAVGRWPKLQKKLFFPHSAVLWLLSPSPLGAPAAGLWSGGQPPWEAIAELLQSHDDIHFYLGAMDPSSKRFLGMWSVQ